MKNVAMVSTGVIVGTFDGHDPSQWNTKTGEKPTTAQNLAVLIFTPVTITPATVLRGDTSMVLKARVKGGEVGCDSDHYSDELTLKAGAAYAFFIDPEWDPAQARSTDPWVLNAWPINPDGTIQTALEGDVPLSVLAQVVVDTPVIVRPTPMPSPSN